MRDVNNVPFTIDALPSGVALFAYSPDARALVHFQGNAEELLGAKLTSLATDGNLFMRHVHSEDRFSLLERIERAVAGRGALHAVYRWIRPDSGTQILIDCRGVMKDNILCGTLIEVAGELSTANGEQLGNYETLPALLNALPTLVVAVDRDLRIIRLSPQLEQLQFQFGDPNFRCAEMKVGALLPSLFANERTANGILTPLTAVLEGRSADHFTRIPTAEKVYELLLRPLHGAHGIDGVVCCITDISEAVRKEHQLSLLQRSEALRVLAAGLAHNLNNSLQMIVGHAAAIQTHAQETELVKRASQAIIEAVSRCSELTRYLRGGDDTFQTMIPIDINLVAMASVNRIEDLFSLGSRVAIMFGTTPKVRGHHEVFVDLVERVLRFVCEGAQESELSYVSVKTREVAVHEGEIAGLRAGLYAQLSVARSNSEKPEPYPPLHQTSPNHAPAVEEVADQVHRYGGALLATQSPSGGYHISLFLPSMDTEAPFSDATRELHPEILVVDDDRMVLQTVVSLLRDQGFRCVSAEDHQQALTLVRTHGESLRMAIVDALMPGGDGASLVRKLKRLKESLRIIGFSGAQPEHWRPLIDAGAERVLPKPVNPQILRRAVEDCLFSQPLVQAG